MASWGTELWDRYSCVLSHVNRGGDELASVLAKFVKERGEVEKEYAKNIRKLVTKYTNKMEIKQAKETSQTKGFRLVLQELGFQAGQHEILSDMLSVKLQQEVQKKTKEIAKLTKNNLKEAKKLSEDLNSMYKDLEKTKNKYKKSFLDWEEAKDNFTKADSEGILSRKEIAKLKSFSESRNAQHEDYKGVYASQLVKTNKYQEKYYYKDLPAVINSLQTIEIGRVEYFKDALAQCVAAEKQVAPIIERCREDMGNLIKTIDPVADSLTLIPSLKTGEVPPANLAFEEITSGSEVKFGTLGRRKSKLKLNKSLEEEKLFPKKRELENAIENIEAEIEKGNKEVAALQLMVQSYTTNPKFGDAKKFQAELDSAIHHLQVLESDLHALNTQLKDVNDKLDEKSGKSPKHTQQAPVTINITENISLASDKSGSAGYGTISNCSSSDRGSDSMENVEERVVEHDEYHEGALQSVVALYSYDGDCSESSIAMEAGEEFFVTESDEGGWTKVVRKIRNDQEVEGYVPTAYLQWL